ncbi:hypothetical protein C8Q76DRAFT_586230, partial [Earliella scabrosa]
PMSFSCEAILEHVTIHIVCGNHALAHADKVTFTNCLVVMRPRTLRSELPTRSTVRTRIENEYAKYLDRLR